MKYNRITALLAAICLICLSGCRAEPAAQPMATETAAAGAVQEPANVYAEFVIERFLAQRPDAFFFSDAQGVEYANRILLTFDAEVTDFRFLALEGIYTDNGDYINTGMQELYRLERITPEDVTVVETVLDGLLPPRGICFTDSVGVKRCYYLALSGEDNVPLLVPFDDLNG